MIRVEIAAMALALVFLLLALRPIETLAIIKHDLAHPEARTLTEDF